jgi:hypothetical protein
MMRPSLQLAHLGIEVPDPPVLSSFLADVIGLVPGSPAPDGTLTWRNDDKAHRVLVEPGPANDATYVGFDAGDDDGDNRRYDRISLWGHQPLRQK